MQRSGFSFFLVSLSGYRFFIDSHEIIINIIIIDVSTSSSSSTSVSLIVFIDDTFAIHHGMKEFGLFYRYLIISLKLNRFYVIIFPHDAQSALQHLA